MANKGTKDKATGFIFFVFLVFLWGGYLLPHVLPLTYLDEVIELIMFSILVFKKISKKEFRLFLLIAILYLIYGLLYSANPSNKAVLIDFLQEIKPFSYIYFGYYFGGGFSRLQKDILKKNILAASLCTLLIIMMYGVLNSFFLIEMELGITCFSYALLYFYLSDDSNFDRFVCLGILIIGLFCTRSKYYGEFVFFVTMLFFVHKKIKVSIKYLLLGLISCIFVYYLVIYKFNFYFQESDDAARYALYAYFPTILADYFPLGSGLGSYGSHVSGEIYSPLYYKYGMNNYYGMSPDYYAFIADTYFPVLAEFGVIGIYFFIFFWIKRIKQILNIDYKHLKYYKCGLLISLMIIIESVAGPVFVMSYALIPLVLLGMICAYKFDKDLNINGL